MTTLCKFPSEKTLLGQMNVDWYLLTVDLTVKFQVFSDIVTCIILLNYYKEPDLKSEEGIISICILQKNILWLWILNFTQIPIASKPGQPYSRDYILNHYSTRSFNCVLKGQQISVRMNQRRPTYWAMLICLLRLINLEKYNFSAINYYV